jgi:tetratricopeptide (TPR) repeat protein
MMIRLRLTQQDRQEKGFPVALRLEEEGQPPLEARATVGLDLDPQELEDLRWYLEDYLQHPFKPEEKVAARIARRIDELGAELFTQLFENDPASRRLWARMADRLAATRIEITTGVAEAAAIPWELLRDPLTDSPLAAHARAFVRVCAETARRLPLPRLEPDEPIRILLAICRPSGGRDVPFRSVARRLIEGLGSEARARFQLDLVRPPTYEQLTCTLRRASEEGKPYHVLHFDGHGTHLDLEQAMQSWSDKADAEVMRALAELADLRPERFSPEAIHPEPVRSGRHGYLVFESERDSAFNMRLVGGGVIGELMAETGVPVLVLNACRSAHAEAPPEPDKTAGGGRQDRVRAYGSLAQEVVDKGVAGVVAMRYNVYVETAAQLVADLYGALARGRPLGQAVTVGRKQLKANPLRRAFGAERALQDWPVPVVWEAALLALFPQPDDDARLVMALGDEAAEQQGQLGLPSPPDIGFVGRDETLLAVDRAFDRSSLVLLHGYAGSGKTATAAEFARWYALTGGIKGGPLLFTSFERHRPLARVLDDFGQAFERSLQQIGVPWLGLDDDNRRQVALQVMQQVPLLWIWDNVEPVTGFPTGTESQWRRDEQQELANFLRAAGPTKARFLLTSRRDEQAWLGDLPHRVTLPPMPMEERVQMVRELARRRGRKLTDPGAWQPLLEYTRGNPLTITVVAGQALRDGISGRDQIVAFVKKLRAGEVDFAGDEREQGRDRCLAASLSYGFEHAFSEDERPLLALLHCFQGFVNVEVLRTMGHTEADWCLEPVRGLSREAGIALLDRAAEVGLLTAHGGGYYAIHPALPWFFRGLFDQCYPPGNGLEPAGRSTRKQALRAFVEAMGELGNYYQSEYEAGNRGVIDVLSAEEANLLHARSLAREHGWYSKVISNMQGLWVLYFQTGRRSSWRYLVEEIVPDFVDPENKGPLPGQEDCWRKVTQYRVLLAEEDRKWQDAEKLQQSLLNLSRKQAATALDLPPLQLDYRSRQSISTLAVSLNELGEILREQGHIECVNTYREALKLAERIGERSGAATYAFNLGHAYKNLPDLRDLAEAERWYRRSFDLFDSHDGYGRGNCLLQLGTVALEYLKETKEGDLPEDGLLRFANQALDFYHEALENLPKNAVDILATTNNQIGVTYAELGDVNQALSHWRESIRYKEESDNHYGAGTTRYNIALALAKNGRLDEALIYTRAALANFEPYGAGAAADIEDAQRLIANIERAQADGASG